MFNFFPIIVSIIGYILAISFFFIIPIRFLIVNERKSRLEEKCKEERLQSKIKLAESKLKLKEEIREYVLVQLPNQINEMEKEEVSAKERLKYIHVEHKKLKVLKKTWSWVYHRYTPLTISGTRVTENPFLVSELENILIPNRRTWSAIEESIIVNGCSYPSKFSGAPEMNISLKYLDLAKVDFPEAKISINYRAIGNRATEETIKELFKTEFEQVDIYNNARKEILARIGVYNDKINNLNIDLSEKFSEYKQKLEKQFTRENTEFDLAKSEYENNHKLEFERALRGFSDYKLGTKQGLEARIYNVLSTLQLPECIPLNFDIKFDEEEKIAIVEFQLPEIVHNIPNKVVPMKRGDAIKQISKQEQKAIVPLIHPSITLRFAYEISRNDVLNKIKLLVLNGWVKYNDPRTGHITKAFVTSIIIKPAEMEKINLAKVEPLTAFNNLRGISTTNLADIIPIKPTLSLDKNDPRFVDAKVCIDALDAKTNLASMDWQDFEHLIRELFERVFKNDGVEVKITQASRDKGVDAIIFDPDPIKGGKFIIQAKRYTNTVDVSAVRDLFAVVQKEGASRGILVTTSKYGSDAYEFAKNTPLTLLNGSQLLGLLEQHGYKFRIDINEAKKLNRTGL